MIKAEKRDLDALLAVQVVDREWAALQREAEALPASFASAERALAAFVAASAAEKKHLEETLRKRKQFDLDIEECVTKIAQFRAQQFKVKKNEEYAALGKEIADQEHKKDGLEETALGILEETERLEALLARRADEEKTLRQELAGLRAHVDRDLVEVRRRIALADADRAARIGAMPPSLVDMYDRIRLKKPDGIAVVEVERDACSGCQTRLPPQRLNEVLRSQELIRCEGCGRILVRASRSENASRAR